jgi:hypothetical protein
VRFAAARSALATVVRDASPDLSAREEVLGGHLLLRVAGSSLAIVGRDSFSTVIATLEVARGMDGESCVDYRRLDEFLHRAAADEVHARLTSSRLKLRAGPASLDLPTSAASTLVLPTFEEAGKLVLPAEAFVRAVERVIPAAAQEAGGPLWGVHIRCTRSSFVAEACDGKRFASASERVGSRSLTAMLNRRFVSKMLATRRATSSVALLPGANHLAADLGDVRVIGATPQLPFPGLGTAMDGESIWSADVELALLLEAVETLRVVDEDASLRLEFGSDRLHLSARSAEGGEGAFPVRCQATGSAPVRSVSLRDFRSACHTFSAPRANVAVVDEPHPVVRLDAGDSASNGRWVLASQSV